MMAHRLLGLDRISRRHAISDGDMFRNRDFDDLLQYCSGACRVDRQADPLRDKSDEKQEIFVMGGRRNRAMKSEVGDDPLLRPFFRAGHLLQRLVDLAQILRCMMDRRKSSRLHLKRNTELKQITETSAISEISLLYPERLPSLDFRGEGADALAGFHQAFISQLSYSLPHHRAADPEGRGEQMLRR